MAAPPHLKPLLSRSATPKNAAWDERLAHGISNIASPPVFALLAIVLSVRSVPLASAWAWALFYVALVVLVPCLYIWRLVRRGDVSDFHIPEREQRMRPFLVTALCAVAAWLILRGTAAPRLFVLLAAAGWMKILLLWVITLRWKISIHSASAAGLAVLVWVLGGLIAIPFLNSVPVVAWARLRLRRHNLWQTVAGAALGASVVLLAFVITPGV